MDEHHRRALPSSWTRTVRPVRPRRTRCSIGAFPTDVQSRRAASRWRTSFIAVAA